MRLCIYILIPLIIKGTWGPFTASLSRVLRWVPLCLQQSTLCRTGSDTQSCPAQFWRGLVRYPFPPTQLFQSVTELASTAKKPQLKGLLCEQDTAAQFGPQKEPVRQQIHRIFLLRVKLMHFVNSLHNYIMTRVRVCLSTSSLSSCLQLFTENDL